MPNFVSGHISEEGYIISQIGDFFCDRTGHGQYRIQLLGSQDAIVTVSAVGQNSSYTATIGEIQPDVFTVETYNNGDFMPSAWTFIAITP